MTMNLWNLWALAVALIAFGLSLADSRFAIAAFAAAFALYLAGWVINGT